jgi:Zn finger protein HypA/HybF involved in hydrogenase expression
MIKHFNFIFLLGDDLMTTTTNKTNIECMECGYKFKKTIGPKTTIIKCPKCHSEDIDIGW